MYSRIMDNIVPFHMVSSLGRDRLLRQISAQRSNTGLVKLNVGCTGDGLW